MNTIKNTTNALCEAAEALQKSAMAHEIATKYYNSIVEEYHNDINTIKAELDDNIKFYRNKIILSGSSASALCGNISNEMFSKAIPGIINGCMVPTHLIENDFGYNNPSNAKIVSEVDFNYVINKIKNNPEILINLHIQLQESINNIKTIDEFVANHNKQNK